MARDSSTDLSVSPKKRKSLQNGTPKGAKKGLKNVSSKKKQKKSIAVEQDSSSDDDEYLKTKNSSKKLKAGKSKSFEVESSESEEQVVKKLNVSQTDSSDSDSDESLPKTNTKKSQKQNKVTSKSKKQKTPVSKESDSDELCNDIPKNFQDSDSDKSNEIQLSKKSSKKLSKKKNSKKRRTESASPKKSKKAASESESDNEVPAHSSSDESDEDSPKKKKLKTQDSGFKDYDESDESLDCSPAIFSANKSSKNKRKFDDDSSFSAKKPKLNEVSTLYVRPVSFEALIDEHLKSAIVATLKDNEVEPVDFRILKDGRFAYIDVEDEDAINKSIDCIHDVQINGEKLHAEKAKLRQIVHEIFVSNIGKSASFDDVSAAFPANSNVRYLDFKGVAFVKFNSHADAQDALDNADGVELGGNEISVEFSRENGKEIFSSGGRGRDQTRDRGRQSRGRGGFRDRGGSRGGRGRGGFGNDSRGEVFELFVKHIGESADKNEIHSFFQKAFTVKHFADKGVAFVKYNTKADAESDLKDVQGSEIGGNSITVEFVRDRGAGGGGQRGGHRGGGRGSFGRGGGRGFSRGRGGFQKSTPQPQGKSIKFDSDSD